VLLEAPGPGPLRPPRRVLEQRDYRPGGWQSREVFQDQSPGDVTAQSAARMDLNLALGLGGNVFEFGPSLPVLEAVCNELRFYTALKKEVDRCAGVGAQTLIVRHCLRWWAERVGELLNGKKWGWH